MMSLLRIAAASRWRASRPRCRPARADGTTRAAATALAEAVELATVPLGRPALAGGAAEQRRHVGLARRWWRAVVDEAVGRQRRRHPLVDELDDLQHPLTFAGVRLDAVADAHRARRLHRTPVDRDVA